MKKFNKLLSILLTLAFCFILCSCGDPYKDAVWHYGYTVPLNTLGEDNEMYLDNTSQDFYKKENGKWKIVGNKAGKKVKNKWDSDKKISILAIGNSFSDDALWLLPNIFKSMGLPQGYRIHIANLYIGSCALETHYFNIQNESTTYTYKSHTGIGWQESSKKTIFTGILDEDWDYITLQQNSASVGLAETYDCLSDFVRLIEEHRPNAKIGWHMTWAFQQDYTGSRFNTYNNDQMTMYNALINATKTKVKDNLNINFIIPNGTVIQNARTSFLGDTLTRDGYHLTKDIGRYMAALSYAYLTTGYPLENVTFAPAGVTDEIKAVCIESVKNAVLKPFEVTQSAYTTAPSNN